MLNRATLLAVISMFILGLAGCGGGEETKEAQPAAAPAAPPPPKAEEKVEIHELTKDDITSYKDWTSRNISILGAKIGDKTRDMEKEFGKLDNTRTLPKTEKDEAYYLTIYQGNGLFVYTVQLTGRIRKFEVYETFAKKIADEKLQKLFRGLRNFREENRGRKAPEALVGRRPEIHARIVRHGRRSGDSERGRHGDRVSIRQPRLPLREVQSWRPDRQRAPLQRNQEIDDVTWELLMSPRKMVGLRKTE
ncbi:MAG: hypothetical protein HYU27_06875 [Acidobacteria bacterium]|nr:hypothetical protein [Acidobacteriota bacterium]